MESTTCAARTDCFAFGRTPGGKPVCGALNKLRCDTGSCSFYRSKVQAEAARTRSMERAKAAGYYLDGDTYTPKDHGRG